MEPKTDIDRIIQRWPTEYREKALAEIKARTSGERFVFYCQKGPTCDGNPHEGVNYQHARADQWPPAWKKKWFVWMIRSGRGTGKTRTGAEWLRQISSKVERMAMIGRRGKDVRGTMVEGPSGLIYVCERAGMGYDWKPSQMEFTFANGAKVFGYSAEEPDSLRGPQHGAAWLDEPAHMALIEEVWSNLLYGIRLPGHPGGARILCTSTPLPLKWLRDLEEKPTTKVVRVSTRVNMVNLDPMFIDNVIKPLEGTRNGRQELDGEILTDTPGALWKGAMLITYDPKKIDPLAFDRVVVGVDPAGTANKRSDETGIIVAGVLDGMLYVIADYSGKYSPRDWANKVLYAAETWSADAIVAEQNFGGDMVKENLENAIDRRDNYLAPRIIITRSVKSKEIRAEPIVGLYEHEAVAHAPGLTELEDEQLRWIPGKGASPNRIDALVFALTELHGGEAMTATAAFPTDLRIGRDVPRAPIATAAVPRGTQLLSIEDARAESDRLNFAPPGRSAGRMYA